MSVAASVPAARSYTLWRAALLNAFWVPLHFQDTALIAIAVPAALVKLAPANHLKVFAVVAALVSFVSMAVPPVAGAISDRVRRRGVGRRAFIVAGAAVDVGCLIMMAEVHTLGLFVLFFLVATAGANVSLAAYQALLPDIVPKPAWGSVSGVRSIAMVIGTVAGIGVAAGTYPETTFIGIGAAIGLGALTMFGIPERDASGDKEDRAHVSDWHDFIVVFIARAWLAFGLSLLMTFILYFFRDVLHVRNPSAGTGFVAAASLAGAIVSGAYLGWLSDRYPRKRLVAACGIPMALAAAGFGLFPEEHWMYAFAVLFGAGFGGVLSTGWALAIDSVPKLRDVARDLGIWGIAQNFPAVVAPLFGAWLLSLYGNSLHGFQLLFFVAAGSFTIGSLTVLGVGVRPFLPWWARPLRRLAALSVWSYVHTAYRIRRWGAVPRLPQSTLVISNHQIDLDLMENIAAFILRERRESPLFAASAKLMHEPGFMAMRVPWMSRILGGVNLSWLFSGFGLLPIENQLRTRAVSRWAWSIARERGCVPLDRIFKAEFLGSAGLTGLTTSDVARSPYRAIAEARQARLTDLRPDVAREQVERTRRGVAEDVARIETMLRRGASFYVTPEGDYTTDGRMRPFRAMWHHLERHAKNVYLVAIAYDPFRGSRLSQLSRIVPLGDRAAVVLELQRARPLTASAVLGWWLQNRATFSADEAIDGVRDAVRSLPAAVFVDPELRAAPARCTIEALGKLQKLKIVERASGAYRLGAVRRHRSFPGVADIVAFEARVFEETLAAAVSLGRNAQGD